MVKKNRKRKPNAAQQRNALRLKLLEHGYEPLPLAGKACYVKGWSFAEINEDFIKEHARKAAWLNTGIRCGHVVAVDIDIDDAGFAEAAEAIVERVLGPTSFCRFGKGEKRMLLYWNDEPIAKRRTARYRAPQAGEDGPTFQVEVLGKGCQFAAYGIHPGTGQPYEWTDAEPFKNPVEDLPAATGERIDELVTALEEWLEAEGLQKVQQGIGGAGGRDGQHDYCLTDDMAFEVVEPGMGLLTVAELREQLPKGATWHCNLTAIRPGSDSKAGRISWSATERICITDFVAGVTYFETLSLDEAGQLLGQMLPEPPAEGGLFPADPGVRLAQLVERYVYVKADDTVRSIDDPCAAFRFGNWSKANYGRIRTAAHPNGVLLANAWLEHPDCKVVDYTQLRPDTPQRILDSEGRRILNTYTPPKHPEAGGEAATFWRFLEHLVPDRAERELVADWIANKVQRPEVRQHALVMVAEKFGTGRGTLTLILEKLFGEQYHTQATLAHLLGQTAQSQYNDWLSGALLVSIPEAQDSSQRDWHARRRAYESLKQIVETQSRRVMIVRKGVANTPEVVYTSLFIATNHVDALAIEDDDRRLIVVGNGAPLSPEAAKGVYQWMERPENIGALYRALKARTCVYDATAAPPMTDAKRRMLSAAESDLDYAWKAWVERAEGDVCTYAQWRRFALDLQTAEDLLYPDAGRRDQALKAIIENRAARVSDRHPKWIIKVKGAVVRPWILRNTSTWRANGDPAAAADAAGIRAEIEKNGDPGGAVVTLPRR